MYQTAPLVVNGEQNWQLLRRAGFLEYTDVTAAAAREKPSGGFTTCGFDIIARPLTYEQVYDLLYPFNYDGKSEYYFIDWPVEPVAFYQKRSDAVFGVIGDRLPVDSKNLAITVRSCGKSYYMRRGILEARQLYDLPLSIGCERVVVGRVRLVIYTNGNEEYARILSERCGSDKNRYRRAAAHYFHQHVVAGRGLSQLILTVGDNMFLNFTRLNFYNSICKRDQYKYYVEHTVARVPNNICYVQYNYLTKDTNFLLESSESPHWFNYVDRAVIDERRPQDPVPFLGEQCYATLIDPGWEGTLHFYVHESIVKDNKLDGHYYLPLQLYNLLEEAVYDGNYQRNKAVL